MRKDILIGGLIITIIELLLINKMYNGKTYLQRNILTKHNKLVLLRLFHVHRITGNDK